MSFVRKNNYRTKYFADTFKDALLAIEVSMLVREAERQFRVDAFKLYCY